MWKNYLKLALRNLWKYKGFSLINITGLTLGLSSFILILLYVHDEWSYDGFHEQGKELYRITTFESQSGVERFAANSYYPLAPALEAGLPAGSKVVRYLPKSLSIENPETQEITQEEDFFFADSLFFDLFSFEFITGNKQTALRASNSLVITQSVKERLFGKEDPIGKALHLESKSDYLITGVVKDPPPNSTIRFDFIAPMSGVSSILGSDYFHPRGAWYYQPVYTFAYIPDPHFANNWKAYQPKWKENHLPEHLRERYTFHLQPIADMHFEALENDLAASVKPSFLWVLVAIAFLVLGIACINYVNLALTRLIKRFPEIGMRKVLGAMNRNILQQMSLEAALFVVIALVLGIKLVSYSLPYFNQLTDKELVLFDDKSVWLWPAILFVAATMTLIIALFPYFGLSRYKIIGILKGNLSNNDQRPSSLPLKNGLVVFQFVAAIGMILATLIVQYQLHFINNKDMGFQPERVLIAPIRDGFVQDNYQAVKNTLIAQSGVTGISAISNIPWESGFYDFPTVVSGGGVDREINTPTLLVDIDFVETMNIRM